METKGANRMEKQAATGNKRWVITVESRNEQHQEIILQTIAKRAYQLFEETPQPPAPTFQRINRTRAEHRAEFRPFEKARVRLITSVIRPQS